MRNALISKITIAGIMILMVIVVSNLAWNKQDWKEIIRVDGRGYYAYLPAVFIYHDLNLGFFNKIEKEKYFSPSNFFDYRTRVNNTYINKYFCGTALAQLPFFLAAHLWCYLSSGYADGYSMPYMVMISLAALFYLALGLVFIRKTLILFDISELNIVVVLLAVVFGTHIFYYSSCEAGMSHIYSFAFIAIFIYYGKQFFRLGKPVYILVVAILLGLLTLIRPVNLISVFILPFLSGGLPSLKAGCRCILKQKLYFFLGLIIFILLVSVQSILYRISAGTFFIYSYQKDGFNFLAPHMVNILFSYRKGLFLYTPVLFVSLIGEYYMFRKNKFEFYSLFAFLLILTYVLSCWFQWWYGGSFSSRVYIEYIPLFAILLGIALEKIPLSWLRKLYIGLIFMLIIVCQVQTYQYRYYKIHWSDMTREKYWKVFMRVDQLMISPPEKVQ